MRRGRNIKHLKPDVTRVIDKAAVDLGNTFKTSVRKRTPRDKGSRRMDA